MPRNGRIYRVNNSGRNQTRKLPNKSERMGRTYRVLDPKRPYRTMDRDINIPIKTLFIVGMLTSLGALTYCNTVNECSQSSLGEKSITSLVKKSNGRSDITKEVPYFFRQEPKMNKAGKRRVKPKIKKKVFRDIILSDADVNYYESYKKTRYLGRKSVVIPIPEKRMIYIQRCGNDPKPKSAVTFVPTLVPYHPWELVIKDVGYNDDYLSIRWAGKSLVFTIGSYVEEIKKGFFEISSEYEEGGKKRYHLIYHIKGKIRVPDPKRVLLSVQLDSFVEEGAVFQVYYQLEVGTVYLMSQAIYRETSYANYECAEEDDEDYLNIYHRRLETPYYYEADDKLDCYRSSRGLHICRPQQCTDIFNHFYKENYLLPELIEEHSLTTLSALPNQLKKDTDWIGENLPRWNDKHLIFPMTFIGGGMMHEFETKIIKDPNKKNATVLIFDRTTADRVNEIAYTQLCVNLRAFAQEGMSFHIFQQVGKKEIAPLGSYTYHIRDQLKVRGNHCGIREGRMVHIL